MATPLRFQPFTSDCDPSFWSQYGKNKLEVYRLDDDFHHFSASYTVSSTVLPPRATLSSEHSFESPLSKDTQPKLGPMSSLMNVAMKNFNTLHHFKDANKVQLLKDEGELLYSDITTGKVLANPSLLVRSLLLSYVDLKKHNYLYWFAFPSFNTKAITFNATKPDSITLLGAEKIERMMTALRTFTHLEEKNITVSNMTEKDNTSLQLSKLPDLTNAGFFTVFIYADRVEIRPFSAITQFSTTASSFDSTDECVTFLGFLDPSGSEEPGWPLRNALYTALVHANMKSINVLAFRDPRVLMRSSSALEDVNDYLWKSTIFTVTADINEQDVPETNTTSEDNVKSTKSPKEIFLQEIPTVVGWEKNVNNKLLPRQTNLSSLLDAKKVMDAAVDLNLKLMRWRVLPNLDIAKIQSTKVLLVGSGTLGCNVARSLLGWGVKNFTFIDNGRVSHSNPVRQSLFTFEDCAGIGKYKVHAAAEALQRIYPGVQAQGVVMSIPMPGHEASSVSALDEALVTCDALHALIESHDIIYLLTDTRESRWLPTLIAQALNKPCINAALGFNSYVVMRHGARDVLENQEEKTVANDISSVSENSEHLEHPEHSEPQPESEQTTTKKESSNLDILRSYQSSLPFKYPSLDFSKPPHLGCYFCSDVVAPSNSMRDRTLDQQCTVTRPGLSMISSGLVAELTVAMLHHSKNYLAPAITFNADDEANEEKTKAHEYTTDDDCSGIGMLPHQMRGDMYTFEHQLLVGGAQSVCSGCGDTVVQMYRNDRRAFITKVINETGYLEEACGLAQLQREAEEALQQIEEWNNDSFDGDDF